MARKNLLIMGGDQRYLEVAHQLASKGIHIFLDGYDQLTFSHSNISNGVPGKDDLNKMDAILLPLNGTDTAGGVEAVYSERSVELTYELLEQTPAHCTVFTGVANDYLDRMAEQPNKELIQLTARDDVAILNSIPTAEATLNLAIQETDYTIHGANILVLGFGRVGITVSRLFAAIGAHVSVAARKDADFARITEMGMQPLAIDRLVDYMDGMGICINTIPHPVLDQAILSKADTSMLIIDIASKPGGTDFKYANEKGMKAIHALGLPGKTAPKTAGRIIGDVLYGLL
ncbi:dipicolinate synthase subunit DpsA [Lentibacillus sediminis]|uniref:dipicolinate synthase subunit DpsA n=1 Tax=Lentibacillus sediminis TaxID=1940529 RepID=UPI001EFE9DB0|nr:dipicolinate synthase subunit DpsA [Lentibacillus sediminis]